MSERKDPRRYFYRLAPPTGYHELARLEFQALTGDSAPEAPPWAEREEPSTVPRIAWARVGAGVQRSAYVAECCRLLARAEDFGGLLKVATKLHLGVERFRVRVHKMRGIDAPGSNDIQRMVADVIDGRPDLDRPAAEMVVIAEPGQWLLGELVSRTARGWAGHEQRPHQYSAALPPRLARALVNLVAPPGDRLLDPCCGVGTVLVEAAAIGVRAVGCDINRRLVEHAAANLCHHGLKAELTTGDGREVRGRFDGAVLDLPYGYASRRIEGVYRGLVARAVEVARLVAVVTVDDVSELLTRLGAEIIGTAAVMKGHLVRRVHWARGPGGDSEGRARTWSCGSVSRTARDAPS